MVNLDRKDLKKIYDFWEDEVISTIVYKTLAKKATKEKQEIFLKLADMEAKHAGVWSEIAQKYFNVKFKLKLKTKIKIFFYKLLSKLMPLTFMLNYLELGEVTATLEYARFLEKFKDEPETYNIIKNVVYDEIEHEHRFAEMLIGEKGYINKIKDAIYGMTDSLVEILALVIGLSGVISNPLTIGLAGLISTIGGTFSMTTGAFLSAKSQNEVYEGKMMDLDARKMVAPETLAEKLIIELESRGVSSDIAKQIADELMQKPEELKNMVATLAVEEAETDPKETAKTTGIYYILGALPAILPFFIGYLLSTPTITIAILAVLIASLTAFIAGIYTAVLSGVSVMKKSIMNVLMIIGAALATYAIGSVARILLGIEV